MPVTLIDFYILQAQKVDEQRLFACRLIEKAVRQGNKVMVATKNEKESRTLDHMMWSFRPDSFVPHARLGDALAPDVPVVIGHDSDDGSHHDVLVNLRLQVPPNFSRFQRLAEIVIQDETFLKNSRTSYSYYRSRGYPINTHKLK